MTIGTREGMLVKGTRYYEKYGGGSPVAFDNLPAEMPVLGGKQSFLTLAGQLSVTLITVRLVAGQYIHSGHRWRLYYEIGMPLFLCRFQPISRTMYQQVHRRLQSLSLRSV